MRFLETELYFLEVPLFFC